MLVPEVEQVVRTEPDWRMSMMVEPDTEGEQSVKVTLSKSTKLTRLPPELKSSTIHSALYSQSWLVSAEKEWVTVLPVVVFSRVTVPAFLLEAVAVMVIVSPAEMEKPEKS